MAQDKDFYMDKIGKQIAGEIALSITPGQIMKKWREIFGLTQVKLSEALNISPSTISDYEGNRRKSPGSTIIKRFVGALVSIDMENGSLVLNKLVGTEVDVQTYYELHEFSTPLAAVDIIKVLEGRVVANEELLNVKKVYGYTLIDSVKAILDMPSSGFPKLFGSIHERAFIFLNVSTGRSPMVVVRVSQTKPSIIVLHNLAKIDELALRIAEREQIPIITTKLPIDKIKEKLNKI